VEVPAQGGAHRLGTALSEAVVTKVVDGGLAVHGWHPGRGVERHRRA
jgi:hypothetical protein